MSKNGFLYVIQLFLIFSLMTICTNGQKYNPRYWLEGVQDPAQAEASTKVMIDTLYKKGWRGIWYWGADRDESKMIYHFKSPFLKTQSWAVFGKDGLTPLVKMAHARDMKVIVNLEAVNPFHWEQHHWTPYNIAAVAKDLAATGIDGVFEESFEEKPAVFSSLARALKNKGVNYISGTDPMILRYPKYPTLWSETGVINMYNYYLKRDKLYGLSALSQHGTIGYGWARYWNKPTALTVPINRNWGIAIDYAPAVASYLCMIRALQFRVDNFMIFGGTDKFDPVGTQAWISAYIEKQEARPLLNIVLVMDTGINSKHEEIWNRFHNSADAITSGAFNGGYNIVVSSKPVAADAYWIYAPGADGTILPREVIALFNTRKKVFLQAGYNFPGGPYMDSGWRAVLEKCGIVPPGEYQEESIPYTGYYRDKYLRFTGWDAQWGDDLNKGTVFPAEAIVGKVFSGPNGTYGKGPFIIGKDNKYAVTASTLDWSTSYPISNLLSGGGVFPSSNVWGIAGKNVSAFLAVEATELEAEIPGLAKGSKIHVAVWDKYKKKKFDSTITYQPPFRHFLQEYDLILIDGVN